jgi:hypothetical protein
LKTAKGIANGAAIELSAVRYHETGYVRQTTSWLGGTTVFAICLRIEENENVNVGMYAGCMLKQYVTSLFVSHKTVRLKYVFTSTQKISL